MKGRNAKFFFVLVFTAVSLVSMQANFSPLVGQQNQFFTFFQFFGPIAGGFLGALPGALSVLLAQVISSLVYGKEFSLLNVLRFLPMAFAAAYFAFFVRKNGWKDASLVVPLAAIAVFLAHPVGKQVWFYSLFWTIPIVAKLFFSQSLLSRSLGATFTAHAVGGAIWVYSVPMTAEQWIALIPIVAFERLLFAGGIVVSYVAFNTLLYKAESTWKTGALSVSPSYGKI